MWLVANDLEVYAEEFSNKNIDGKQLLNLDGSKLKVRLGVYSSLMSGKIFKGELFSYLTPGRHASASKPKRLAANPREKTFARITVKTWSKPETAHVKSLAPGVG